MKKVFREKEKYTKFGCDDCGRMVDEVFSDDGATYRCKKCRKAYEKNKSN